MLEEMGCFHSMYGKQRSFDQLLRRNSSNASRDFVSGKPVLKQLKNHLPTERVEQFAFVISAQAKNACDLIEGYDILLTF